MLFKKTIGIITNEKNNVSIKKEEIKQYFNGEEIINQFDVNIFTIDEFLNEDIDFDNYDMFYYFPSSNIYIEPHNINITPIDKYKYICNNNYLYIKINNRFAELSKLVFGEFFLDSLELYDDLIEFCTNFSEKTKISFTSQNQIDEMFDFIDKKITAKNFYCYKTKLKFLCFTTMNSSSEELKTYSIKKLNNYIDFDMFVHNKDKNSKTSMTFNCSPDVCSLFFDVFGFYLEDTENTER